MLCWFVKPFEVYRTCAALSRTLYTKRLGTIQPLYFNQA